MDRDLEIIIENALKNGLNPLNTAMCIRKEFCLIPWEAIENAQKERI